MPGMETEGNKPIDYGDFMEVTSAITGRRVFINKMAVMYINEPYMNNKGAMQPTDIWFDKDMHVPAAENYDDIVELFLGEDEDDL